MDAVIKLPRGVLSYTGVDSVILVLKKKKHRYTKDIKFVYADDCIISDGRNKKLNYQAVIERLEKKQKAIKLELLEWKKHIRMIFRLIQCIICII